MVLSIQSLYAFNDIRITQTEEIVELNYIPYIKDSLIKTGTVSYYSSKGDCDKVRADLNFTQKSLEEEIIKNGVKLTTFYTTNCPSPQIYFNFTLKSQDFYSTTEFVDELYCDGVLCLKFDEGYENIVHDFSNYWNDGVLGGGTCSPGSGNCPSWTSGKLEKALYFDGNNKYVLVPDDDSLDGTDMNNFTLQAWIRVSSFQTDFQRVIHKNGVYQMYIDSALRRPVCGHYGGSWEVVGSVNTIALGQWYHVACVYNHSQLSIYLNGNYENYLYKNDNTPDSTDPLIIGLDENLWEYDFSGTIDSVRIYNRALTQAEIQADMNKG